MLLLASSCLQGRPLLSAARELLALEPDGLQLCPGHPPQRGLRALLTRLTCPLRTHHGFSWAAYRQPVWSEDGEALLPDPQRSLHPPETCTLSFEAWLDRAVAADLLIELMVPGRWLGSGAHLEAAMRAGLRLAVDVSHLFIQREQGAISEATLSRVLDYDRVGEVHLSDNDGRLDSHRLPHPASFGFGWARARAATGLPLVVESYLHRVPPDARLATLEPLR